MHGVITAFGGWPPPWSASDVPTLGLRTNSMTVDQMRISWPAFAATGGAGARGRLDGVDYHLATVILCTPFLFSAYDEPARRRIRYGGSLRQTACAFGSEKSNRAVRKGVGPDYPLWASRFVLPHIEGAAYAQECAEIVRRLCGSDDRFWSADASYGELYAPPRCCPPWRYGPSGAMLPVESADAPPADGWRGGGGGRP